MLLHRMIASDYSIDVQYPQVGMGKTMKHDVVGDWELQSRESKHLVR
jgi:hypothetical protein